MKVFTKRFFMIFAAFALVLGLVACGPEECDKNFVLIEDECIDESTVITFSGVADINHTLGDDAPDYTSGITVSDVVDGDLTSSITVDSTSVNLNAIGTYQVTLSVTNSIEVTKSVVIDVIVAEAPNPEMENAKLDLAEISVPDGISTPIPSSGLTLPKFGSNGTFFYWSSSHPLIITKAGDVIPPHVGMGDTTVTLKVKAVNGTYSEDVEYEVRVRGNREVSVTSKAELPFEGTSTEYVVEDQAAVEIFYVDNGSVPYIDIETFIDMVDGALDSDIIGFEMVADDQMEISYSVTYEDFDGTDKTDEYTALVDFTENTFTVNNFDFFESYVASTSSDYGEGLDYVDAEYTEGKEVTIPLGEYNFDLVIYDDNGEDEYLMPFHVANLLFVGGVYYDVYYNGDKLWGIDTFGISSGGEEADAIHLAARTSSLNAESVPDDMKEATYNFLALALDYFYGLKEDRNVDTYYDSLSLKYGDIMDASDNTFYRFVFNYANGLDDLHTSHSFPGYYFDDPAGGYGLSLSDLGTKVNRFYDGLFDVQDLLDAKFGGHSDADIPEYEILSDDKTAVIYLTGFTIDSPDAFKATVNKIKKDSSIENIVVDLAYNTGGNIGAVLRIFGYITDQQLQYHSQNPADGSAVTYFIDVDYNDYDQFNWYIKTSSVTFSAANMMSSMAKELGIPVLGQKSSGGASSIGVIITPDGSTLLISTNNVLSTRTSSGSYKSVEKGVSVDYKMSNVYDDQELIDLIAEIQAEE